MEEEEVKSSISRRRIMKRAGVGAAIVWSAPVLSSLGSAAHAQTPPPDGEACDCDVQQPCNMAIPCQGSNLCNCWVRFDRTGCFCGPFDACINHEPCGPNGSCPSGQVCISNCCGDLCYAPCGAGAESAGPDSSLTPAELGVSG